MTRRVTTRFIMRHSRLNATSVSGIIAAILIAANVAQAQFSSFFDTAGAKRRGPTTITANKMDVDLKQDVIELLGNVKVDEENTTIDARKITVFLAPGDQLDANNKRPQKIIAEGNVVIVRKALTPEEKAKGAREVTAGKVIYDIANGKIFLSRNPVLSQGKNSLRGYQITIFRDEDRVVVKKGPDGHDRPTLHVIPDIGTKK